VQTQSQTLLCLSQNWAHVWNDCIVALRLRSVLGLFKK
jgi:hypothetical protein